MIFYGAMIEDEVSHDALKHCISKVLNAPADNVFVSSQDDHPKQRVPVLVEVRSLRGACRLSIDIYTWTKIVQHTTEEFMQALSSCLMCHVVYSTEDVDPFIWKMVDPDGVTLDVTVDIELLDDMDIVVIDGAIAI